MGAWASILKYLRYGPDASQSKTTSLTRCNPKLPLRGSLIKREITTLEEILSGSTQDRDKYYGQIYVPEEADPDNPKSYDYDANP